MCNATTAHPYSSSREAAIQSAPQSPLWAALGSSGQLAEHDTRVFTLAENHRGNTTQRLIKPHDVT